MSAPDHLLMYDVPSKDRRSMGVYVCDAGGKEHFLPFSAAFFWRPSAEYENGLEVFIRKEKAEEIGLA